MAELKISSMALTRVRRAGHVQSHFGPSLGGSLINSTVSVTLENLRFLLVIVLNGFREIGSCSQIVDRVKLNRGSEFVAIHKESDDGVMHKD